ncbi:MAG: autotransporter outer membrane beta-barrel domain-containing protein [Myxococcota bacterium]
MLSPSRARLLVLNLVLIFSWQAESALAHCDPDPPMDDDTVVCDDSIPSTGFDGSAVSGLTVSTTGNAILNDSDPSLDSALLLGDDNVVTTSLDTTITVTQDNGFGIRALNNNFIDSEATIDILGIDGRGISIGDNTTGILPNGAVNQGTITATGLRSIALETGSDSGVATTGTINLIGNETRGLSAASRTDFGIDANITNQGTINVFGNDAIGMKAGDNWVDGQIVGGLALSQPGLRNLSGFGSTATINVTGERSFGIFVGDETNLLNNHNTFVFNTGLIDVTGDDAIGISVGGNDLLGFFDFRGRGRLAIGSLENTGEIRGGPNAGPLVDFRNFFEGNENSFLNNTTGQILADLGSGAIAIHGSSGSELIVNVGEIQGIVELNDGDDRYVHFPGGLFSGEIRGGLGDDRVILISNSEAAEVFDVSPLIGIETLEIGGGSFGWELANASAFTGLTEVAPLGLLRVPTSVTLGGGLSLDETATLEITLDPATTLTILGSATFDGSLIPILGTTITPGATQYRVISADGGYAGQFQNSLAIGTQLFLATYDEVGLLLQYAGNDLVAVARGSNQRAIARHLIGITAAGSASPDLQNMLDEFDGATGTLANVFNALNPEIYDADTTVIVSGGQRVTRLLFDRPRNCPVAERLMRTRPGAQAPCPNRDGAPWLASIGGIHTREKFGDHSRYTAQLGGLVVGIDFQPMEELALTFAIASQRGTIDGAGVGKGTITLTDLSGHAAWRHGPLRIQAAGSWGHGFHKRLRRIRFSEADATAVNVRGVSEYDSDRISIAGELGYEFDFGPIKLEPIGGIHWAWVYQRPIHETETAGFGIRIDRREDRIGSINGGLRFSTSYEHSRYLKPFLLWMDGLWEPSIEVRWRQVLTGNERELKARLEGSPDGVSKFTIEGREDHGGIEFGTALRFLPKNDDRLQIDLRYQTFVSSHAVSHDLALQALIAF